MSLETNPMLIIEMLEVIKKSAVECKDKKSIECVCLDDIHINSLLWVINSVEEIIRKLADHEST